MPDATCRGYVSILTTRSGAHGLGGHLLCWFTVERLIWVEVGEFRDDAIVEDAGSDAVLSLYAPVGALVVFSAESWCSLIPSGYPFLTFAVFPHH